MTQLLGAHKCTSKLVKYWGLHFFQKMHGEELKEAEKRMVVRLDGIHSEQELADFCAKA